MASQQLDDPAPTPKPFRWSALFRAAPEPLYVLNPRLRVLYVNAAWEALTGLTLEDVRGQPCRRRRAESAAARQDVLLAALAPPAAVKQGRLVEVRRRLPTAAGPIWAMVQFFALLDSRGEARILGKIRPITTTEPVLQNPLPEKLLALHDQTTRAHALERLPQHTPELARLHEQIRLAAQTRTPVSLVGPRGAGKHWLARCLHHETFGLGRFFARLDCARLPADAVADVFLNPIGRPLPLGTVYLHAADCLPRDLQARLAGWLEQEHEEPTPRLVAGFLQDPSVPAQRGMLLPELHCRLSVLTLLVPALAERTAEWPWLLEVLLARASAALEKPPLEVFTEARQLLSAHTWPGNLAELYRVLLGACERAKGPRLEPSDLPYYLRQGPAPAPASLPLDMLLEQVERKLLTLALGLTKNKKTRAAELLAIWRPRLLRRLEALGITDP